MIEIKLRSLKNNLHGVIDLGIVFTLVMVFAALMVIGYIIWTMMSQLAPTGNALRSMQNVTAGFDDAVSLILVAITIFILALAIGALLLLRGRG